MNEVIEEYYITIENIYNVDKKGFLIRISTKIRRIISRNIYEKGRYTQVIHDSNHEFITCIIYISALGTAIPPVLLYKGASRDLQDI